jgi:[ribosomal protein S18]-alanine N-acetyltransferase
VRVRSATVADLDRCLPLFVAVAEEARWIATQPPVDRRELRARWKALLDTGEGTLLVAEDGGAPVGLAVMVGRAAPELGMLVAADRRGHGIGSALVEACLAWARAAGAGRVVLHVFPHNTAARALYRKHGFAETGVVAGAFPRASGEVWDAIRMERPLQAAEAPPPGPSSNSR